ncbi:hypothetical protein CLV40_109257 [Actinokineospora auranticolor]|uniref:Uncharacterized protein n=1 Tax=Actinokineospora auranticolor TaxID=155976 RepID=A0A2S6GNQ4_9PSEU|nr:hypothetical protein CLV40_109257 [Actinokineospora auranticolor]
MNENEQNGRQSPRSTSVVPAHAGLLRTRRPRRGRRRCRPRARGAAPSPLLTLQRLGASSPRTRGCSGGRSLPGHAVDVVPAHVGLLPPTRSTPWCVRWSSPRTRGCSGRHWVAAGGEDVVPALAGLVPTWRSSNAPLSSRPRACGLLRGTRPPPARSRCRPCARGAALSRLRRAMETLGSSRARWADPHQPCRGEVAYPSSSRTRGYSHRVRHCGGLSDAVPAHAGCSRLLGQRGVAAGGVSAHAQLLRRSSWRTTRWRCRLRARGLLRTHVVRESWWRRHLRARGAAPPVVTRQPENTKSSPPTRAASNGLCGAEASTRRPRLRGAGPRMMPRKKIAPVSSRTRGAGPTLPRRPTCPAMSTPRMRGWSARRADRSRGSRSSPRTWAAPVNACRFLQPGCRPHARGAGPLVSDGLLAEGQSSPRTRGSSCRAHRRAIELGLSARMRGWSRDDQRHDGCPEVSQSWSRPPRRSP